MIEAQKGDEVKIVLFVDIGGNRELESLGALLPWLSSPETLEIPPRLIIVKSQELYKEMDQNPLDESGWGVLQQKCAKLVMERSGHTINKDYLQSVKAGSGLMVEMRRPFSHASSYSLMLTSDGKPICRFHNYSLKGCLKHMDPKKQGTICPFDHDHCHTCGEKGHIAMNCQETKSLIQEMVLKYC